MSGTHFAFPRDGQLRSWQYDIGKKKHPIVISLPIGYTREHARVVWKTPAVDTLVRSLDRILPILFFFLNPHSVHLLVNLGMSSWAA